MMYIFLKLHKNNVYYFLWTTQIQIEIWKEATQQATRLLWGGGWILT